MSMPPIAPTIAAMTVEERATAMLDVMARLAQVFDREVEAVRTRRPHDLTDLNPNKQKLMIAYEEIARALRIDSKGLTNLRPEIKERLIEGSQTLRESGSANAARMGLHTEAHRRVVDMVVQAINESRRIEAGYSPRGAQGALQPRGNAPSMALDTKL